MALKPVFSRFNSASADKCLRTAGARVAIASSNVKRGQSSRVRGELWHEGLRKGKQETGMITGVQGTPGIAGYPVKKAAVGNFRQTAAPSQHHPRIGGWYAQTSVVKLTQRVLIDSGR